MELEFRATLDDAWYNTRILQEGDGHRLRIKFVGFPDEHDEVIDAKKDLEELSSRFRPVSAQLQDSECSQVAKGMLVCAAHSVVPEDRRFYDAIVDEVVHKEHRIVDGQEECTCSFVLLWKHGPKAHLLTAEALENICRVQTPNGELDPRLTSFLRTAREKIEATSDILNTTAISHQAAYVSQTCRPKLNNKTGFSQRSKQDWSEREFGARVYWDSGSEVESCGLQGCKIIRGTTIVRNRAESLGVFGFGLYTKQDTRLGRRSSSHSCVLKEADMIGDHSERFGNDENIGGIPHMIIIENLEKGLSPLKLMEFIHQQVSISCQALVYPSKLSEMYTRGAILLANKKNFDKLCDFLENPDHIIISSGGRPWLVTEKTPVYETLRAPIETFIASQAASQSSTNRTTNELKVVVSGAQEYRKAKQLRDLFQKFANHQCQLHQTLHLEEGKIWQAI